MKVGENTEVTMNLKAIVAIAFFIVSMSSMWFAIQADIEEAKKLPEPVVSRTEYDLKDKLVRETIMNTQQKVEENGAKLDLIETRLYELSFDRNK